MSGCGGGGAPSSKPQFSALVSHQLVPVTQHVSLKLLYLPATWTEKGQAAGGLRRCRCAAAPWRHWRAACTPDRRTQRLLRSLPVCSGEHARVAGPQMAAPDLKAFILRSEVLHLYRQLLRVARGAHNAGSRGAPSGACHRPSPPPAAAAAASAAPPSLRQLSSIHGTHHAMQRPTT